jgi:hypothetical protein
LTALPILPVPVAPVYPELAEVVFMGVATVPKELPIDAVQPDAGTFTLDELAAADVRVVKFHTTVSAKLLNEMNCIASNIKIVKYILVIIVCLEYDIIRRFMSQIL